jgi:uncharacterized protein
MLFAPADRLGSARHPAHIIFLQHLGAMVHPDLTHILAELRAHLQQVYQERLVQVMLFGSQARGEATEDSDIDVLIVLQNPVNAVNELNQLSEFIANLCLKYNTLVSCVFMSDEQFQRRNTPLLLNIRQEGIAV